jgi:DNA mismatch repair protein MutL
VADADDLDSGVDTLGFRGEALSSIGAVAKLTVRTKPPGAAAGTELRMEGGDVAAVERVGCPVGTTVEVTDLFYNTPAREKYLEPDRTEFGRVNDVVTKYALARPDVAVRLAHDGREVAEAMVPVEATTDDADGPLQGVEGCVSHPETTRSSREYVAAFVNGRYVQSAAAKEAVVEAYGSQLGPDRYPFAVLDLQVPPGAVVVNVHPRKRAVRFADEDGVREQVERAVRETLLGEGLVRSSAPRGRSAPDEATVEPEWPDDGGDDAADSTGAPAGDPAPDAEDTRDAEAVPDPDTTPSDGTTSGTADAVGANRDGRAATSTATGDAGAGSGGNDNEPATTSTHHEPVQPTGDDEGRAFDATDQRTLDGEAAGRERDYDSLPPLRVLGQYDDTYVVAASPDGLVLVDQHAADERVHYERNSRRGRPRCSRTTGKPSRGSGSTRAGPANAP